MKNICIHKAFILITILLTFILTASQTFAEDNSNKCVIIKDGKLVYNPDDPKIHCATFQILDNFWDDSNNTNIKTSNNIEDYAQVLTKEDIISNDGPKDENGADTTNPDDNTDEIPEDANDTETQCGVPTISTKSYIAADGTVIEYKTMKISKESYANIASTDNLPTELSNANTTFTATCTNDSSSTLLSNDTTTKTITFTCKLESGKDAQWVANATECSKLSTLPKCWSASGGMGSDAEPRKNNDKFPATINTSLFGFIDTDCCNSNAGLYVDLNLKLQRALCEKEASTYNCIFDETSNTYSFNEDIYNANWKNRTKEEKLIKYISLSDSEIDLRCLNLSGINMSKAVPSDSPIQNIADTKISGDTSSGKYIHKLNTSLINKVPIFSARGSEQQKNLSVNDGTNPSNSNFSKGIFEYLHFGFNIYSYGDIGCNLTNANFSNSIISDPVFSYGVYTIGNVGANLTNANFSNSIFKGMAIFGLSATSLGNIGTNLTNANFSNCDFSDTDLYFGLGGTGGSDYGSLGSNLTNADFSNTKFASISFDEIEDYSEETKQQASSNVNGAKFAGATFSGNIIGTNTNFCKIASFDSDGKIPTTCIAGLEDNVPTNTYNPYCYFNSDVCCGEWNSPKTLTEFLDTLDTITCKSYGYDGTK